MLFSLSYYTYIATGYIALQTTIHYEIPFVKECVAHFPLPYSDTKAACYINSPLSKAVMRSSLYGVPYNKIRKNEQHVL